MSEQRTHAPTEAELLADALRIILSVQAGHWEKERPEWQDQAGKWRDDYLYWLAHKHQDEVKLRFAHTMSVELDEPNNNGNGNGGNWFWSVKSEIFLDGAGRQQPVAELNHSGWEHDKEAALAAATETCSRHQSRLTISRKAKAEPTEAMAEIERHNEERG